MRQSALVAGALAALACSSANVGTGAPAASAAGSGSGGVTASSGVGGSAGSAGMSGGGSPAAISGEPCNAPTDVFPVTCASIVCHEGTANKLDLLSPGVDQRLLDVPAMGVNCGKTGVKLVDSQNPEQSLILLKLTTSPPCGSPMPLGSGPSGLKPEQLTCIHDYVVNLAGRAH
jgi:hypothetical protein